MTQENPTEKTRGEQTEDPQGEQAENAENAEQEAQYYYSINSAWMGPGLGMRRIHHKGSICRIGARIRPQNRIEGRRDDTLPCRLCCPNETIEAQDQE